MKCDEFEAHLNEILDERRRPEWDERLRLHGELCAGCRQLAAAYGVLFEGLFEFAAIDYSISPIVNEFVDEQLANASGRADPSVGTIPTVGSAVVEVHDDETLFGSSLGLQGCGLGGGWCGDRTYTNAC